MALAETFTEIVESLPGDWTDLEFELRLLDVERYIEAATYLVQVNAQPLSKNRWHFRIAVAHTFGHAAAAPPTHGTLRLLDEAGIEGEIVVREVRQGRAPVQPLWGRPESTRREIRRLLAQ
jgi:hypothetical protein